MKHTTVLSYIQPVSRKMSSLAFQQFLSSCRPKVNELTHMEVKENRTEHSTRNCMLECGTMFETVILGIIFQFRPFEPYLTNVNY